MLIGVSIPLGAADHPRITSHPPGGVISIDGRQDDWTGPLQTVGKEPFSVDVANDDRFLYLRLVSSDPGVRRQILRLGLTVWFDEAGGTKKKLGIRYPVIESGEMSGRGASGGFGRGRHSGGDRPPDEESAESAEPPDRVDILGPGKDEARSLTREHLQGVEVAVKSEQGSVLYELKVPLQATADHPYAIGSAPGKVVGVGFETPKLERPSVGRGAGGGFGGGRGGDRIGGMGGRGGMRGGEREFAPPKPLKAWVTVALSAGRDR